jgi:leader peptidase (prepilin peptidase)/N-methyltransferase
MVAVIVTGFFRTCRSRRISLLHPLAALVTATLFVAAVAADSPAAARIAIDLVLVAMLVVVTLTDLERRIIPNEVLLAGAILCLAIATPTDLGGLPERWIAAAGAGGLMLAVVLVYPQGMGLGDVKLTATMGLFLGPAIAPALFFALLSGSLVGLALIARYGSEARKMTIPFGPFLALGGVVGMLAGDALIGLYLG